MKERVQHEYNSYIIAYKNIFGRVLSQVGTVTKIDQVFPLLCQDGYFWVMVHAIQKQCLMGMSPSIIFLFMKRQIMLCGQQP